MNRDFISIIDYSGDLQKEKFRSEIIKKIESINANPEFENYKLELVTFEDFFREHKTRLELDFKETLERDFPELKYEFVLGEVAQAMQGVCDSIAEQISSNIAPLVINDIDLKKAANDCGLEDMKIRDLKKLSIAISRFKNGNSNLDNKFNTLTLKDRSTYLLSIQEDFIADRLLSSSILDNIVNQLDFDFSYEQPKDFEFAHNLSMLASSQAVMSKRKILKQLWIESPTRENIYNSQN
jgi:hypothetical protein